MTLRYTHVAPSTFDEVVALLDTSASETRATGGQQPALATAADGSAAPTARTNLG